MTQAGPTAQAAPLTARVALVADVTDPVADAELEAERRTVLIGRFLQPDEIARTVAFLAGPGGDAYVGQVLSPNGGTVFGG